MMRHTITAAVALTLGVLCGLLIAELSRSNSPPILAELEHKLKLAHDNAELLTGKLAEQSSRSQQRIRELESDLEEAVSLLRRVQEELSSDEAAGDERISRIDRREAEAETGRIRLTGDSDLSLDDIERMAGREWIGLNATDRDAVVFALGLVIALSDEHLRMNGFGSIDEFLDAFYANAGNVNVTVYAAADHYLRLARGVVLTAEGRGNKTTDSFYYDGRGYLMFQTEDVDSAVYSISVYDDETTGIVAANVVSNFGDASQGASTRLRLRPGVYYLEVNCTVPWQLFVLDERGIEWLKRTVHAKRSNSD